MTDQPLEIRIDLSEIENFGKALEQWPDEIGQETRNTLQIALDTLEQSIVGYTPVNTGLLRGSIANEMRGDPLSVLTGEVFTPVIYGEPVEYGRKPGKMPPVDAIELWVRRKLQVPASESRQVAYLIARSIGRHGTKGAEMFGKGFDNVEANITKLFEDLPEKILKILENKP